MTKREYLQIKKDVEYIEKKYGKVYDYCGGWCNNDILTDLLENPTYETAYRILKNMLQRYWRVGYDCLSYCKELLITDDSRLQKIQEKYGLG